MLSHRWMDWICGVRLDRSTRWNRRRLLLLVSESERERRRPPPCPPPAGVVRRSSISHTTGRRTTWVGASHVFDHFPQYPCCDAHRSRGRLPPGFVPRFSSSGDELESEREAKQGGGQGLWRQSSSTPPHANLVGTCEFNSPRKPMHHPQAAGEMRVPKTRGAAAAAAAVCSKRDK